MTIEELKKELDALVIKKASIKKREEDRAQVIEKARKDIVEANNFIKVTQETKDNAAQELFFIDKDLAKISGEIENIKEDIIKAVMEAY